MTAIKTINDLLNANKDLVAKRFAEVTIMEDLQQWLRWLNENENTTHVTVELRRSKSRNLGIHPSSACKKDVCPLKLYYECTHKISPKPAYNQETQLTWDIGTILHSIYQRHFHNMYGEQFKSEVHLEIPTLHITGHADGIFNFNRVNIVWEAKSIKEGGSFGWEKIQQKPMEDNVRQLHLYMKAANTPFGIIFYMNKNKGLLKEHPIMFDPTLWEELEGVIQPVINAAYNNGPMVGAIPGWHCRWCDFNYRCPSVKKEKTHVKGASKPWGSR